MLFLSLEGYMLKTPKIWLKKKKNSDYSHGSYKI